MKPWSDLAGQRGLSLVELMIAMTLGLVLTAAMGYFYLGSRQTYRTLDGLARLQESGRYTLDIIARDVRMAGYRGCVGPTVSVIPPCPPVGLCNTLNNATQYAWNFGEPIQGFNDATGGGWPIDGGTAIYTSSVTPVGGTDIITLRGAFGAGLKIAGQPSDNTCLGTTADLKVTANNELKNDDIVMVTNCTSAAIFQITNFNSSQNVVHNTGTSNPGNSHKDLGDCFLGGELIKVSTKTYYIGNNPADRPALYRIEGSNPAQELVENVSDMQISYGVDNNSDFAADAYLTANDVDVANWAQVISVHVDLLVSSTEDNIVPQPQQFTFNGATFTAPDRRLYKVFSTTIGIRNRLP